MHAGQNVKMMPGAMAACALPMGLGLIFTALLLIDSNHNELFMTLPVALCFLCGTPLSAWLACRRLRNIKDSAQLKRWGTIFWAGLKWASLVHIAAATLYTISFSVIRLNEMGAGGALGGEELFSILFMSGFINATLWFGLTLPFTLLCATIFWRATKFPEDVSVF